MKTFSYLWRWGGAVVFAFLMVFLTFTYVLQFESFQGAGMAPNLKNRDTLVVWRMAKVKRLSVIALDAQSEVPGSKAHSTFVKRVIGVPGDRIISRNGQIYVNGKQLDQSFLSGDQRNQTGNWTLKNLGKQIGSSSAVVPKGKYFVLSDDRSTSHAEDSRDWGYVSAKNVVGVAKLVFWDGTNEQRQRINQLAN